MKRHFTTVVFVLAFMIVGELAAMTAEPVKMTVWRKGESIFGEEFIAANEQIVDYLATLRRPTGMWDTIKYNCFAKSRLIRPSVREIGSSTNATVDIRMVYELRDCQEIE